MNEHPPTGAGGEAVAERIIRLGRALQSRGIDVALTEIIDASRAATVTDLASRNDLRVALRSTMVKHPRFYAQFDAAFDRLFPARPPGHGPAGPSSASDEATDPASIVASDADLAGLASDLVDAHAGLDGELRSEGHHMQRAYRGADLARMMSEARKIDPTMSPDEIRARIEELKRLMAAAVRAHIGEPDVDTSVGDLEDVEFLNASRAELDEIRQAIRPLARKIAARLARRRQHLRTGRVHMRRTARRSLGTGGVPINVAYERPRAHRPELFVLCDISGSVADFSLFTLTLVSALSAEVTRTRSFVFVDAVDEITDLLASTDHAIEPWQLLRNTNVIGDDGHSDYGKVLDQFWSEVGEADLRPSSTVIITGDARSNYRPSEHQTLAQIARRCRRVYWFNPEPRGEWDTHDSEMTVYADSCSEVLEVRNLRQLATAVEHVL